ncbi:MAG: rhomboid family intramembrane serine protease [Gemmatimonadales bacterium]|nr:MAG: rhomboid family intramembrane serine protease [Gemmatimonadales bacterium]
MYAMTPWVTRLLILNVVIYFLTAPVREMVFPLFGWIPAYGLFRPWTIITYQFLHANFLHLLFNMIGLFFFGPRLENKVGGRHFLGLYLVSGVVGGLLSVFTPFALIVGASGAVFGILLGFARYYPDERIFIYGIIPIRARVLVIGLAVISVWAGIQGGGNVAHFAHLGGFVGGWAYLKLLERNSGAERFKRQVEKAQAPSRPSSQHLERWRGLDVRELHPVNRDEYERIMGKLDRTGPASLSADERAFLERMSAS